MAGLTILVTGVNRYIGSTLAGRLAATPGVDRVIGVDAALPEPAARARMGDAEFARADIRNPLISRVLDAAGVDTVVHASASATPASSAARTMVKEMNVLGTMQLLAACQRTPTLRSLVVRSTAAVYGGSPKDPAVLREDMLPRAVPSAGPARDAIDIEGYVRGFARRRPDVRVAVPRFAEIIGPTVRTPLTRLFSLSPIVPLIAGRDARMQLVHERDAVAVMEQLALGEFSGVVNVAGDGVLMLGQAIHRAGRIPLPVAWLGLETVSRVFRLAGIGAFSTDLVRRLAVGRVLDTTRLTRDVGYRPAMTTEQAFDDFARILLPVLRPGTVQDAELRIAGMLGIRPESAPAASGATTALVATTAAGGTTAAAGTPATRVSAAARPARTGGPRPPSPLIPATGRPRLVSIDGTGAGPGRGRGRTR